MSTEPPGYRGQGEADRGDDAADDLDGEAQIDDIGGLRRQRTSGDDDTDDHQGDRPARQRLPDGGGRDLELDLDLARQRGLELTDPLVHGPQPLDGSANHGQRMRRRMGRCQAVDLGGNLDRLAIPVVALGCGRSFGADPLRLAGLLEQAATFGQRGGGIGSSLASRGQRVTVALELSKPGLALLQGGSGLGHGLVGHLEPSRVALALGHQVMQGAIQLPSSPTRATVGAADRGLQSIAQRAFVAGQVADLEVTDRRRRAEERLRRDAGQLGQDLVGQRRVGNGLAVIVQADRPLAAGKGLLDGSSLAAVLVVLLEFDRHDRASLGRSVPRSEALELGRGARRASGQDELERSLHRGLAGLVRAPHDRQPGREGDIQLAIAPEVPGAEAADPHRETS